MNSQHSGDIFSGKSDNISLRNITNLQFLWVKGNGRVLLKLKLLEPQDLNFSTTKGNFMYCLMMIRLDTALLFREYNSLLFHWICVLKMSFSTASQRSQNFCHASLKNQKLWLLIIALKVLRISLWPALTWGKRRHFTIFVGKNGSAAPISSIYRILTPVRQGC